MNRTRYRFPEPLRFKHLNRHELFMFPAGDGTPAMGPYMKLSARRYIAARVELVGERLVPHIADRPVLHVGSINALVSDRVTDHIWR